MREGLPKTIEQQQGLFIEMQREAYTKTAERIARAFTYDLLESSKVPIAEAQAISSKRTEIMTTFLHKKFTQKHEGTDTEIFSEAVEEVLLTLRDLPVAHIPELVRRAQQVYDEDAAIRNTVAATKGKGRLGMFPEVDS